MASAYDDDWTDQPGGGVFRKWGLGIVLAAAIVWWGTRGIAARQMTLVDASVLISLHGVNAIALGAALISRAVFLHCHYFWGNIYSHAWLAVLGKIVSACGVIAGLGTLIVHCGVFGMN